MEDENKITSKIAMPSAAKIIKEKKLDISDIASTGVNNRVTTVSYTHLTLPTIFRV